MRKATIDWRDAKNRGVRFFAENFRVILGPFLLCATPLRCSGHSPVFIASASTELQSAATQNGSLVDDLAAVPSCPTPDFSRGVGTHVTLLNPLKVLVPPSARVPHRRSLLVYVPGMDCTGQGIRPQLPSLVAAGHDIRCVYIPSSNRV
ncbi:uncharacterized protein LOC112346973 [Selaginella moellendorffii]|uniref:uncharacterized protein LOC112346973 n=1 Tax=Selaginella moellendorffii TaxID=88036 RepID=UPI000D1C36BA|nr:uncharacterized protein LOC112346973 [Selaginella moellendorffii]|eukprot:XP_024532789.1 uncharacterized protein LOC112346973 [Selaginella moellendorffii]